MNKNYLIAACFFGALAVILGAFGAHKLEDLTVDEKILHAFNTGVQYEMYHSLALIGVYIVSERSFNRYTKWAANCFVAGIVLFSGSLYLLTLLKTQDSSLVRFVGPLTPLGGLFFIAGWVFFLVAGIKKNKN